MVPLEEVLRCMYYTLSQQTSQDLFVYYCVRLQSISIVGQIGLGENLTYDDYDYQPPVRSNHQCASLLSIG